MEDLGAGNLAERDVIERLFHGRIRKVDQCCRKWMRSMVSMAKAARPPFYLLCWVVATQNSGGERGFGGLIALAARRAPIAALVRRACVPWRAAIVPERPQILGGWCRPPQAARHKRP